MLDCDIVSDKIKDDFNSKIKSQTDDPNLTYRLCEFLVSEKSINITGRLISSVYDKLPSMELDESIFTLRRIDNIFFKKV